MKAVDDVPANDVEGEVPVEPFHEPDVRPALDDEGQTQVSGHLLGVAHR